MPGYRCPACGADAVAVAEVMSFADGSRRDIGVVGFCARGCGWGGRLG
ncbi:hypothetical protein YT1_0379 [Rhodococcus ruber]|nr:hypothetical protein YT1_0379 [Rhodococcus ruber]